MYNIINRGLVPFGVGVLLLAMGLAVACEGDAASETVSTPALTSEEQRALDFLTTELAVDSSEIDHVDTESHDWPDSSLGCPAADTAYLQVITPGYKYVFSHLGEHHAVHSGTDGSTMVYCK